MSMIKVNEANYQQLDWMVAGITNPEWTEDDRRWNTYDYADTGGLEDEPYSPTTDWAQGGKIIEREEIAVQCMYLAGEPSRWMADSKKLNSDEGMEQYGPTPLVAAMRCLVVSKLGEEVEVPDGLL